MIEFISFDLSFSIKCKHGDDISKLLNGCNCVSQYTTEEYMSLTFDFNGDLSEFIRIKNILSEMKLLC